jgi:lipocalin
MIAYSEADKKNTFQLATSCQLKGAESNWWDRNGKLDEHGSGALRLTHWFIFHSNYWVFAVDPDYTWALVGNPNHRSLWILAKSPTLPAATLDSLKAQATAAGYDVSKLIMVPYQPQVIPPPPIKMPGKGQPPPPNSEKGSSR